MRKISFIVLFFLLSMGTAHAENAEEYKKLISYLDLSLPQLAAVRESADAGDYEAAAGAFVEYYSQRQTPVWSEMPKKAGNSTTYNTTEADQIRNLLFSYNGGLISAANSDGSVNWQLKPDGQKEWMWTFNRQFQFVTLSRAYVNTGKNIYAEAFVAQFNDWYLNNPMPAGLDTEGTWRTLEAGIRIGSSMISYLNNFVMSDAVPLLTKTRILLSLHEHGEYLSQYCGTNNWLLMESKGFYSLVYMFPEFKDSQAWKSIIFGRLNSDFSGQFLQDGWQHELTPNYHIESVKSIYAMWDMANKNGDSLPYEAGLLKAYTSAQAVMGAGTFILPLNDTHSVNQSDFMFQGAALLQSQNAGLTEGFLASASGGLYGNPGAVPQTAFYENAGYMVLRDGNFKKGISAFFETGASGVGGHGWMSRDKLQFTLTAFDRDLLIDTGGSTTYGQEPLSQYTYTTPAHNTVTIDGCDQIRRSSDSFAPGPETKLLQSDKLVYAQGIYDEKYDETKRIDVTHKRRVAFVKSAYFAVRDELAGGGTHTARQYWNLAPGKYVQDAATGVVRTDFEDGNNVMIIPVGYTGMESSCGAASPMLGWTSEGAETLNFCYKQDFTGFGQMEAVIVPYQGKTVPDVRVSGETGKIQISFRDYVDLVSFTEDAVSVERTYLDGHTLQMDFSGQAEGRREAKHAPVIPCNGKIQAEWSGFAHNGLEYHYDSQAKNYGTAVFHVGAGQTLRTAFGISAMALRAKGQGMLYINGKPLAVDSGEFRNYTVSGIAGGTISVRCTAGTVAVDQYEFTGGGPAISLQAVRQRQPAAEAALIFAQSPDAIRSVSADFMPIRSLSAVHRAYFGFRLGAYTVRYNAEDHQIELARNGAVVAAQPCYLHYGAWHHMAAEVSGGTITVSADGEVLLRAGVSLSGGSAGITSAYVDLYMDNLTINGATEDFEARTVGAAPWGLSESGGKWLVEGIENQYEALRILSSAEEVLPGTAVTLMLNNAEGARLFRNGQEVAFTENTYTFTAPKGVTSFSLRSDAQVSEPVVIRAVCDTEVTSAYLQEDFSRDTLDSRWKYTADFVPSDGMWHLSGLKGQQTEVYNTLASPATGKVAVECDFIPDGSQSEIKLFVCRDSANRELHTIKLAPGGSIVDSATNEKLGSYISGARNRIRVEMDIGGGTYTAYHNGALLVSRRKMPAAISDIKRIYAAMIWNGSTGTHISGFRMDGLAELSNAVSIQKRVGESEVLSETLRFKNDRLYAAAYEGGRLKTLDILTSGAAYSLCDAPVRFMDWKGMLPASEAAEYFFSLTPGFAGSDYFYADFTGYAGGLPGQRWGGTSEALSAADGAVCINGSSQRMTELYYDCLDTLDGKLAFTADITAQTDAGRAILFTFRDPDGGETPLIEYGKNGKIYDHVQNAVGSYTAGEKNRIRVEIDLGRQVFSLWVDNALSAGDIPLSGTASGVKRIYLAKIYQGSSGVILDNFTVSTFNG